MIRKSQYLTFTVGTGAANQRIDKVLATIPEIATRSQAAKILQMGYVRKSGRALKPSYLTQLNDIYEIQVPVIETEKLLPYDFPLDIVYEDADLIVVNKPAGLVVHPACGHEQDTLVNALLNYTTDLSLGYNERRPGLVHRIDKDTSGLLVIAKHDESQRHLALQFSRKTTRRLYRAIAYGDFKSQSGTIRSYLKRHPEDRKRMASLQVGPHAGGEPEGELGIKLGGKMAVTHYTIRHQSATGLALVELRLETGRTHQIRVHLSELGHPIVGDIVYGSNKRTKNLRSIPLRKHIEEMPRFALHAAELGFIHPVRGENLVFRAPWPDDLKELLKLGGFDSDSDSK